MQSYTKERLLETVENNLNCTLNILKYNKENGFYFFRISSELVPFASHPINEVEWWKLFDKKLEEIGKFIKENNMRISMHPDQFVLINSPDEKIFQKSLKDLEYHCRILEGMGLDSSAKIQIHVGGVYNDKPKAIERFIDRYNKLPLNIKNRLVIENDDKSYSLK
ncbi:MAG TPA: UV DNA damage repair endonuclease UvsE, partial [Allocoleopsis sp.]